MIPSDIPSAAVWSNLAISSANFSTAFAAVSDRIAGGNSKFTATPTAAPIRVSTIRSDAGPSAPPTPSTSMALIGTSTRCGPNRRIWPIMIEAATRMPRLHQVISTNEENQTASMTPATTLTTR